MGKDCTDDMITSSANQQMKHLSQLMKRAKERKKEQVFVVEGIKMFQEAPADTVVSVYVSEVFWKNRNMKNVCRDTGMRS